MSDEESVNISELCRICMGSGSFFLNVVQLDMDGEEITCQDMLLEFSSTDVFNIALYE